ncbi:NAD-dependent epimerase/dehydratase family protein, partial [Nocardia cyriacigeorgica]|nr:NAD-dependent epimerase/dehydratase family protein [Nocardia cyriacigeorgica]
MKVVVAGSSGLIGTALVAALRRDGHQVVRLVRRPAAAADEYVWDPARADLDEQALRGADAVVNLCGAGIGSRRWTGSYKQELRDSRITPTDV